ncbi:MAG: glycoside hydrolase family 18 protein [Thermodesulfobacteriota bacterium]
MRVLAILAASVVAASVVPCLATDVPGKKGARPFRIVGYLPEYRLKAIQSTWGEYLTDIIYFSVEPKETGDLDTSRLNERALRDLRALAPRKRMRILIAVGGWGRSKGFAAMATNETRRRDFVRRLTAFCTKHALDGADLDWEFPRGKEEEEAYCGLIVELAEAFRPERLLLTAAIRDQSRLSRDAYRALNYVHLMSYDRLGRHATYAHSIEGVERQLVLGVPKEKLCLGVPFYGRHVSDHADVRPYKNIVKNHRPVPDVDEVAGIHFNGIATIQRKARFARDKGLGGVMIWELGQDTTDHTSLLRAVYRSIRSGTGEPAEAAPTIPR